VTALFAEAGYRLTASPVRDLAGIPRVLRLMRVR